MLNLLLNPKNWLSIAFILIIISVVSYGYYWKSQYNKSQANNAQLIQQLASSKASQELLESAVQRWKAAAVQYDKQLKRREALVAKMTEDSNMRINIIFQTEYSSDCNTAIKQGVAYTNKLGFHWTNNIP